MRRLKYYILAFTMYIPFFQSIFSQTSGTLTFTLTTNSYGGYTPKHVVAIWVEDNSGNFIKTKLKDCSSTTIDHLGVWTTKSAGNVVDALTGPTLTSHGVISVEWNGTNAAGTLVPDGIYNIWIEMAWADSKTVGKTYTSFQFTKGPDPVYLTPASTENFLLISLKWIKGFPISIKNTPESEYIRVYPNPTSDKINLAFSRATANCRIKILNVAGIKIFEESSEYVNPGIKTIDLSKYANGLYFINVGFENKLSTFRIVKNK